MHPTRTLVYLASLVIAASAMAGAWGYESFEDDDALDWLENGLKPNGQAAVERAIKAVAESTGYLELPECSNAIAACEVLAAVQGRPSPRLPPEVAAAAKSLASTQSEMLRKNARTALEKILAESELRSLWAESRDFENWKRSVEDLKSRI